MRKVIHDGKYGSARVAKTVAHVCQKLRYYLHHKIYFCMQWRKDKILVVNLAKDGGAVIHKAFWNSKITLTVADSSNPPYDTTTDTMLYHKDGTLDTDMIDYFYGRHHMLPGDYSIFLDQDGEYKYEFFKNVPDVIDTEALSHSAKRKELIGAFEKYDMYRVMTEAIPGYTTDSDRFYLDIGPGPTVVGQHTFEPIPTFMGDFIRIGIKDGTKSSDTLISNVIEIGKMVFITDDKGAVSKTFKVEYSLKTERPLISDSDTMSGAFDVTDCLHYIDTITGKEILILVFKARVFWTELASVPVGRPRMNLVKQFVIDVKKGENGAPDTKKFVWESEPYIAQDMRTIAGFDHNAFNFYRIDGTVFLVFYNEQTLSSHIYTADVIKEERLTDESSTELETKYSIEYRELAGLPVLENGTADGLIQRMNLYGMLNSNGSDFFYITKFYGEAAHNYRKAGYAGIQNVWGYSNTLIGNREDYVSLDFCIGKGTNLEVQKRKKVGLELVETYKLTPLDVDINMMDMSETFQLNNGFNRYPRYYTMPEAWSREGHWEDTIYAAVVEFDTEIQRFCPIVSRYGGYVMKDNNGIEHPVMSVRVMTQKLWPAGDMYYPMTGSISKNIMVSAALLVLTKTPVDDHKKYGGHVWSGVDAVARKVDESKFEPDDYWSNIPGGHELWSERINNLACDVSLGAENFGSIGDKDTIHYQSIPSAPIEAFSTTKEFTKWALGVSFEKMPEFSDSVPTQGVDGKWWDTAYYVANYKHPRYTFNYMNSFWVRKLVSVTLKEYPDTTDETGKKKIYYPWVTIRPDNSDEHRFSSLWFGAHRNLEAYFEYNSSTRLYNL